MVRIDLSDGFDFHDYRRHLKLIDESRERTHLQNRGELDCPACGKSVGDLLVIDSVAQSLGQIDRSICVARAGDRVLVVTHDKLQ